MIKWAVYPEVYNTYLYNLDYFTSFPDECVFFLVPCSVSIYQNFTFDLQLGKRWGIDDALLM